MAPGNHSLIQATKNIFIKFYIIWRKDAIERIGENRISYELLNRIEFLCTVYSGVQVSHLGSVD